MAFYSGKDGRLQIFDTSISAFVDAAKVRNWSLQSSAQSLETTTLGDLDRTAIYGVRSMTGSCSLFYYAADPTSTATNSASVLLNKLIKAASSGQGAESEEVQLKFIVDDGTSTNKYVTGTCILTSASMQMSVGEVLSAEISFEFVGSPTDMLL